MLRKADNPELFYVIRVAYQNQYPEDKSVNYATQELTDDKLAKITSLKIQDNDIKSLKGIEHLTNLSELALNGRSDFDNYLKNGNMRNMAINDPRFNMAQELRDIEDAYNRGQIEDITPLYQLKKLKKLELRNQRKINEIDFSHNPNLNDVDMSYCTGLKTIKGLESLSCFKSGDVEKFEFGGCSQLKEVTNFPRLVDILDDVNVIGQTYICLPTTTFCHITRDNKNACKKLEDMYRYGVAPINWVEICQGNIRVENTTGQMAYAKAYADATIKTLFYGQQPCPLELVNGVYRWICDNIKYDYDGLEQEKNEDPNGRWRKRDRIRSSLISLIDKKAVCVGISNLFNFMMADLGYSADPCLCSSNLSNDARLTVADHQMSQIYINGETYYCDPTWDLGRKESRYFCLTKEEMEKTHQFTVASCGVESGQSLQQVLRLEGLLYTKPQPKKAHIPLEL